MSQTTVSCRARESLEPTPYLLVSKAQARCLAWLLVALCSPGLALADNAHADELQTGDAQTDGAQTDGAQTDGAQRTDDLVDGTSASRGVAMALARSLPSPLKELSLEVRERRPEIERARHLYAAAAARAPQVRSLPDPVAAFSLFVLPAETRAGPQRLQAALSQSFPWFGTLELRERAALLDAAAAREQVESLRLDSLTEVRRLAYEIAFLDAQQRVISTERGALERYEGAAQARYAAGTSLQQGIVRIQAQITRIDTQLLEIAERRAALGSALNRLRDRPADYELPTLDLPRVDALPGIGELSANELRFDNDALRRVAASKRPDVAAVEARSASTLIAQELAEKAFRPDLAVGLSYTVVGRRDDAAARASRPDDDGDDIMALTGSVKLPVRKRRLRAAVDEAEARGRAADAERRHVLADIDSTIGDLTARLPLLRRHLHLLETVLIAQAREALRSAETAYSTGGLNAVDLLDAEVVLFEVRVATARTRADLAIAIAQLERAIAAPLHLALRGTSEEPTS